MNEISINEAKKLLMNSCAGLYAYIVFDFNYKGVNEKSSAYESNGGVILKRWWRDSEYWWYICDLGDSDMTTLINESRMAFDYDIKNEEIYFIGNIPKDYDTGKANKIQFKFTRTGEAGNNYCDIRLLSESDSEQVEILTSVSDDDSNMAKKIAGNINYDFNNAQKSDMYLLGIFDGITLAGAVSIADRWGDLMHIHNIFVSRDYRGRKYATRLIRAATAMYPGVIYTYDCDTDNFASISSAKSAGYTLAGTYILQ